MQIKIYAAVLTSFILFGGVASTDVRLKDVAVVKDQREIQLIQYGLVGGLEGTGDGKNTQFTIRSIANMMKNMGIEVPAERIKVKNVAAVMVTATVSPYTKKGGTFDVTVSSIGDARSLEGGTLFLTPLAGSNKIVYGMAQGPISVGGTNKDFGAAGSVVKNAQLTGLVPNGGILERELPTLNTEERNLLVTLRNPDFTTAFRLASAINDFFTIDIASAHDAGSIFIEIPDEYTDRGDIVKFISEMEMVTFMPDQRAKVIINERTGTVIAGGNVSIGPVAIMHGTLSLAIEQTDTTAVQQALPGQTVPVGDRMVTLDETANVGMVAKALNMLGVTPRDLIAIFQALKRSGSLRAELIIM